MEMPPVAPVRQFDVLRNNRGSIGQLAQDIEQRAESGNPPAIYVTPEKFLDEAKAAAPASQPAGTAGQPAPAAPTASPLPLLSDTMPVPQGDLMPIGYTVRAPDGSRWRKSASPTPFGAEYYYLRLSSAA
jgi:hypothetical protein